MRITAYLATGLLLGVLAGCGPGNVGAVKGRVTLDNVPLVGAQVLFQPLQGKRPSFAVTDAKGNYSLEYMVGVAGAEVGTHRVQISLEQTVKGENGEDITLPERVPAIYNTESSLRAEVKRSANELNFDLKSN